MECGKDGQWIMVYCNMCVVLLYIKMDFVRGMKKIYGDLLKVWQQDDWSFRILGMREG